MYGNLRVAAVIPAHNEANHIGEVLAGLPDTIDYAIVVDDGSTDSTGDIARGYASERIEVVSNPTNVGVGGSRAIGFTRILEQDRADVIVTIDGDGQMDTDHLSALIEPVASGGYDFAKGNRFFSSSSFEGMPRERVFGNIVLTFLTKLATGYWSIFDPQNGYTAMRSETARRIDFSTVSVGYAYENDILARLGLMRAKVKDVDIPAVYGQEVSSVRIGPAVSSILSVLRHALWKRFWLTYVIRSFSPVALFVFFGAPLLIFSLLFGSWAVLSAIGPAEVSAANAVLTSLTFTTGFTMLLAAMVIDVLNEPR